MTALRDALRRLIADDLRCVKCPAMNRPGVYLIKIDATGTRAACDQCSYEGPLADFQPKES